MSVSWHPAELFNGSPLKPYGIIVLNQPVNKNALDALVKQAELLICADAGADRYLAYERSNTDSSRLPDAIVGDLDSLSLDAERHYTAQGVQLAKDPDQYATDFQKSLKWMRQTWDQRRGSQADLDVIVIGGLGGRVDQGFSQIHHLYMVLQQPDLLRGALYLLSEQSLSFVLAQGHNDIHFDDTIFSENIGIIPLLGLSHISTTGLEWDVENWPTEFGGQISTSNHVKSELVKIHAHDKRPLFTIELVSGLWSSGS